MKPLPRRLLFLGLPAALVVMVVLALRPEPVRVETAPVRRGPLAVSVDEEGETRIHHRYVISAPVAGTLKRIALHEGDEVAAGQVVAELDPLPLDARSRREAEARLAAARAARREAEAGIATAKAAHDEAARTLERLGRLAAEGVAAKDDLDRAETAARQGASELEAARFRAEAARYDVESARAALLEAAAGGVIPLRSPVAGRVLEVCEECERVVAAGASLVEVGDPAELEVVVDVLSSDAVSIPLGAPMQLSSGGLGATPLAGRVRRVEPSGFTKVSPLGVEEQRVNVIGDFVDPPAGLGDRYRIEAKIVLWQAEDVLKVPAGALFRAGEGWAVFTIENGRARQRAVTLGHRNPDEAELLAGLREGEEVIVHPRDRVADGGRVEVR
ncbi:MAG TPA: efflux RND transporter periplasmic adaptor subunit [Thermoanaerobaculia bacterium]|nr:efflux RND transporter periplasmic adaptor subunit [Thermoanaerobaculia bacterium]